jgi:putative hemin transport protein
MDTWGWHWAKTSICEAGANQGVVQTSLQFYDRHGLALHKIYPREATNAAAWARVLEDSVDTGLAPVEFEPAAVKPAHEPTTGSDEAAFVQAWSDMTDTHQVFGLLRRFGLDRQHAFRTVEGRFTHRVECSAVREMLMEAAFDALPIMCFVGNPGCIQIHSGPIRLVEPMETQGKVWLNVLDPGFNLHLREDLIDDVWVVEKPTEDGVVTSLEVFDADGELMAMFFGARKPGQPELAGWRLILAHLQQATGVAA